LPKSKKNSMVIDFEHIPGIRTAVFVTEEKDHYMKFRLGQDTEHHRYVFMQAVVNEKNMLDVSISQYDAALKDGEVIVRNTRDEQEKSWKSLSLRSAVKILSEWEAQQTAEKYEGELSHMCKSRDALTVLSDTDIDELEQKLKTYRQSPNQIIGKKKLVKEDGLSRDFQYVAANKDRQTGLYTIEDTTDFEQASNKLKAWLNNYSCRGSQKVLVAEEMTYEQAMQKVFKPA